MNEHDELSEAQEEAPEQEEASPLDLNTATEEELCQLPGIGPVLAARIVNYRLEVHPFEEPVEITAVPGISETMYGRIADRLTVGPEEEIEAELEVELEAADIKEPPPPEPEPEPIRVEEIPTPRPIPMPPPARDAGWGRLLFVGLAGAVVGAILALLILLIINGTLYFRTSTVKALQEETFHLGEQIGRLDGNMGELHRRLEVLQDLSNRVDETQMGVRELHENLSAARAEMESMAQALGAVRQEFTNLREDLDGMAGLVSMQGQRVDEAEQRINILAKQIEEISGAAKRFDAFLGGLRHLLNESMGQPTPTPWKTPRPKVTVMPLASPTPSP